MTRGADGRGRRTLRYAAAFVRIMLGLCARTTQRHEYVKFGGPMQAFSAIPGPERIANTNNHYTDQVLRSSLSAGRGLLDCPGAMDGGVHHARGGGHPGWSSVASTRPGVNRSSPARSLDSRMRGNDGRSGTCRPAPGKWGRPAARRAWGRALFLAAGALSHAQRRMPCDADGRECMTAVAAPIAIVCVTRTRHRRRPPVAGGSR